MSQLWRDQIRTFLGPSLVNMVGMSRGIRPVQLFKRSGVCSQETGSVKWETSLQLLEQMIAQAYSDAKSPVLRKGAVLTLTLSNHFVRYGIVAPQAALANPDELMAYASFQMREIYGERVDDWMLSLSRWDPYDGALCAAIPRDLFSGVEALALRHKIRLKQIEPYLAAAMDHWSRELNDQRFWFVLIEPGRFSFALLHNNRWRCVRNQRIVQNLEEELMSALEQEAIILGQRETIEQVYVVAPAESEWELTNHHGWRFARLPDGKSNAPAHFPLANLDNHQAEICVA